MSSVWLTLSVGFDDDYDDDDVAGFAFKYDVDLFDDTAFDDVVVCVDVFVAGAVVIVLVLSNYVSDIIGAVVVDRVLMPIIGVGIDDADVAAYALAMFVSIASSISLLVLMTMLLLMML